MSSAWLGQRLAETPLVVIDVETTGLQPIMGHRVVELGAVRYEGWEAQGELSALIHPGRDMDPAASRINGITDADLAGAPPFGDVTRALLALSEGALLVAHNAPFDAGFLSLELALAGQATALAQPWLDTLGLARRQFRFRRNHLAQVARELSVRSGGAHRALADVRTTAGILRRMADRLGERGIGTVGQLLKAQGGPVLTPPSPVVPLPAGLAPGREAAIRYRGPAGASRRTITPRYATTDNRHLYVVAYCHLRQAQRTFRLDRLEMLEAGSG